MELNVLQRRNSDEMTREDAICQRHRNIQISIMPPRAEIQPSSWMNSIPFPPLFPALYMYKITEKSTKTWCLKFGAGGIFQAELKGQSQQHTMKSNSRQQQQHLRTLFLKSQCGHCEELIETVYVLIRNLDGGLKFRKKSHNSI